MTNVEALKNLYVAFGGQLTDTYEDINDGATVGNYATSADVISAIAKKVPSGSGSSLPEVTSEDNGKVLTVVEGAWAKADVPTELPAVSAADDGKVLKVIDGVWNKGTDLVE